MACTWKIDHVDYVSVQDIDGEKRCCTGDVIISTDIDDDPKCLKLNSDEFEAAYAQIRDLWDLDQKRVGGRGKGKD